jgi:hypothetical protein
MALDYGVNNYGNNKIVFHTLKGYFKHDTEITKIHSLLPHQMKQRIKTDKN